MNDVSRVRGASTGTQLLVSRTRINCSAWASRYKILQARQSSRRQSDDIQDFHGQFQAVGKGGHVAGRSLTNGKCRKAKPLIGRHCRAGRSAPVAVCVDLRGVETAKELHQGFSIEYYVRCAFTFQLSLEVDVLVGTLDVIASFPGAEAERRYQISSRENMIPGHGQHIGKLDIPVDATQRKYDVEALAIKRIPAQVQYIPVQDVRVWVKFSGGLSCQFINFHAGVIFYFKTISQRQAQSTTTATQIENALATTKMQLFDDASLGVIELLPCDTMAREIPGYLVRLIVDVFHQVRQSGSGWRNVHNGLIVLDYPP